MPVFEHQHWPDHINTREAQYGCCDYSARRRSSVRNLFNRAKESPFPSADNRQRESRWVPLGRALHFLPSKQIVLAAHDRATPPQHTNDGGAMTHASNANGHQAPQQFANGEPTTVRHGCAFGPPPQTCGERVRAPRMRGPADAYRTGHHDDLVAQSYAFGILLVVLSLITAAAMLATKHPAHMERAACWVVGLLIDWRSWALLTVGLVVVAVTYTLLQPRR